MAKRPHRPLCGARNRHGGTCKAEAGKGTDHLGEGRCKNHGGCSPGGPAGNQHAVTTGLKRRPLIDLPGRAREILDELLAQVESESPRDPAALCRRLREVECSLAAELSELAERRAVLVAAGQWTDSAEDRLRVFSERLHKRLAASQAILATLAARFPQLPKDESPGGPGVVVDVGDRLVVVGLADPIEQVRANLHAAGIDLSARPGDDVGTH